MDQVNRSIEDRVLDLIARMTQISRSKVTPEKTLQDLGVEGTDAWELLESFAEQFAVDMAEFVFEEHFYHEAEILFMIPRTSDELLSLFSAESEMKERRQRAGTPRPLPIKELIAAAHLGKWQE
jgi:hypothetical protein